MFNDLLNLSAKSKHIFSTAQHQDLVQHTEISLRQKLEASNAWYSDPISWVCFKWSQMGGFCVLYSYYQWFYFEGKLWQKQFLQHKNI